MSADEQLDAALEPSIAQRHGRAVDLELAARHAVAAVLALSRISHVATLTTLERFLIVAVEIAPGGDSAVYAAAAGISVRRTGHVLDGLVELGLLTTVEEHPLASSGAVQVTYHGARA